MKTRTKTLVGIGLLVLAYFWYYPTFTWHQKMTIEVETPTGLASGSSVVSVMWRKQPKILPDSPSVGARFYGEATIVALPDGRLLFALLSNSKQRTSELALHIFPASKIIEHNVRSRIIAASEIGEHFGETAPVPKNVYPLLVTFTDINDPTTVQQIDPQDLAASFGEGYALKSITLEITDEPVTRGRVEEVLKWWNNLTVPIGGSERRIYSDPLYGLGKWDFVRN